MKKIILLLVFIFIFSSTNASNIQASLAHIPNDFNAGCYEYYKKINSSQISLT